MCTLAIYFRMFEDHPLLVAANRDEQFERPSTTPALLDSGPRIIAGKDLRAGGTWLGVNEHGVVTAILNRRVNGDSLPLTDARSRGLLCMDLLRHRSAATADAFIRDHHERYNPFTAVVADLGGAYASYNSEEKILTQRLQSGLHVFSSAAEFDLHSGKAERAYTLFARFGARLAADRMDRSQAIAGLSSVLGDHSLQAGATDPGEAICVHREASGTVSSSLVFFTATDSRFEFFHCAGAPCRNSFGAALTLEVR
ncbi:MAG: NRDE family protein [Candidatus Binatia bacterium]